MSHSFAVPARLAAGLVLLALLAAAPAHATHRVAIPVTNAPGNSSSAFEAASGDGSKVLFSTVQALLPADKDGAADLYIRQGGTLTLISAGGETGEPVSFVDATPNLSHVVWETAEGMLPGDSDFNGNDLYKYTTATGQLQLVTAHAIPGFPSTAPFLPYRLATRLSDDGAHVVFTTTEGLNFSDSDGQPDVYERFNNTLRLLSPGGNAPMTLNGISSNGNRVFMTANQGGDTASTDVYESVDGAAAVLATPDTTQPVSFAGVSAGGTHMYFSTPESLNAVLDTDATRDIYERAAGATTLVSTSATAGNAAEHADFHFVSEDGKRVFFTTGEQLDPADDDGVDGFDDIYMREPETATTTLISGGETQDAALTLSDVTPDGKNVFWYSGQSFAGDADGGALDVWRWNEGTISRISVGEIDDEGDHDASYAGRSTDLSAFAFVSDGQLTAADADPFHDVYLRAGGTTTLLTPAAEPCPLQSPTINCAPEYNGISADGSKIWFTSQENLHPADGDELPGDSVKDVYESRITSVPSLDATDAAHEYLEGAPQPVDPAIAITDAGDDILGATVRITAGFTAGDVLALDLPGFTGSFAGDTLTVTGRGTVAAFEAALRAVTYTTTAEPTEVSARTVEFVVTNGGHTATATREMTVTPTDDAPILQFVTGAGDYTNGAGPVAIADHLVTDPDTTTLTGAVVKISGGFAAGEDELAVPPAPGITAVLSDGGATLTLSGAATLAAYRAALKSVTYENDAEVPTEGSRTFEFTALSGAVQSLPAYHAINVARRNIDVTNPVLPYTENAPAVAIDDALAITNFPSETVSGATVEIVEGFAAGEDLLGFADQNGIAGSISGSGSKLTLSGDATVAQYLAALRSVTYRNLSEAPQGADRVIRFSLVGGLGSDSRRVDVIPVEDAPVVTGFSGPLTYTEGGDFLPVAPALVITDADSVELTTATLRVDSGWQPDFDHFTADVPDSIAQDFNEATATLTLTAGAGTAALADFQTALRSVAFFNDTDAPTTATRQLVVTVSSGGATSAPTGRALEVVAVNDPPTVGIAGTPLTFTTGDEPVAVDAGMTVSDPDGQQQLQGATVKLLGEPVEGEDVLSAEDRDDGITVTVDEKEQTVTLVGAASTAAYRNALREVRYANRSAAATGQRTVQVQVTDGAAVSTPVTRTIVLGTAAPSALTAPAIAGLARVGATLTGVDGDWSGSEPMTFARQWQRCAENGTGCADIDGATGATYAPAAVDAGSKLRLRVVADNPADGTVTALSALTAAVRAALAAPLITAGPPAVTGKDSGVVRFSGEVGATFTCALDGAAFADCVSPLALAGLADGAHRVRVRQHREGLTSADAERSWTVDTTAPGVPVLLAGPGSSSIASIGFAGLPGEHFECALDGADFAACSSPVEFSGLENGLHTALIRAVDAAGNAGAPLRVRWTAGDGPAGVARKVTVRAPQRIATRARSFQAGCTLDAGVLTKCDVIARVRRAGHLVRIGRGTLPAGVTGRSSTVTVKLSRAGRRLLRRSGRGARIRVTAIAYQSGSDRSLVDTASLRAR